MIGLSASQEALFPRVYVDLDDVVAETARAFADVLRARFGREVPFANIFSFDLGKSFGLCRDELRDFMRAAHDDSVLSAIAPMAGARETLRLWHSLGAHVAIVTGRPISTYETTALWLRKHEIPFTTLRFVRKYSGNEFPEPTRRRPLGLRSLLGANFVRAIEDSPKMAAFLIKRARVPVLLLDRPWNKAVSGLPPASAALLTRCTSWRDVLDCMSFTQQAR